MRLSCVLLAAAATHLAVEGFSPSYDTKPILSEGTDMQSTTIDNLEKDWSSRSLRRGDIHADNDTGDEERVMLKLDRVVSDLTDDGVNAALKLTRSKSLSSVNPDEELAALKGLYQHIKGQVTPVFKDLAEVKKLNPLQAADEWKIWNKFKTMSTDELASDPFYLFWMKYKQYWDKRHGTAYMNNPAT
ncbi:Secreted RxLR effector peptide protein [Phytophthora palmivora]|uniref:RxLR effector protein n=1 Tax=Phytophthora palmivora TaxID=4796 RepID=A0A2P4XSX4_9STRA|nr:Secreted RxLR effector peptide protein [Phytophthora palmivora]